MIKTFNTETELKLKITKEQFTNAVKNKFIIIRNSCIIEQMWMYDNVKYSIDFTDKEKILFRNRIRACYNIEEGYKGELITCAHCTKYITSETECIEIECGISEDEFKRLRDIGLGFENKLIEKIRYNIKFGNEFEEELKEWVVTVDVWNDRDDVGIEFECLWDLSLIEWGRKSELVKGIKNSVEKIGVVLGVE